MTGGVLTVFNEPQSRLVCPGWSALAQSCPQSVAVQILSRCVCILLKFRDILLGQLSLMCFCRAGVRRPNPNLLEETHRRSATRLSRSQTAVIVFISQFSVRHGCWIVLASVLMKREKFRSPLILEAMMFKCIRKSMYDGRGFDSLFREYPALVLVHTTCTTRILISYDTDDRSLPFISCPSHCPFPHAIIGRITPSDKPVHLRTEAPGPRQVLCFRP